MVDVFTHVVQVVVFTSGPDALLGVGSTTQLSHRVGRIDGVQKDGLELRGKMTRISNESLELEHIISAEQSVWMRAQPKNRKSLLPGKHLEAE